MNKKTYTKKQITEAIAYWKKRLEIMDESVKQIQVAEGETDAKALIAQLKKQLLKIIKDEYWPLVQRKYPKYIGYNLVGYVKPFKIYYNKTLEYALIGFDCTACDGWSDKRLPLDGCWLAAGKEADGKWRLSDERTFNRNLDDYIHDRKTHGRDNMKSWRRIVVDDVSLPIR